MDKIHVPDGRILMEVTFRCYTGCGYCYKRFTISPKGSHVPLPVLKTRIKWIQENTDTKEIYLLGAEPLLHPYFIDLCEFVLSSGFTLAVITSGVVSRDRVENKNLEYLVDLYHKGLVHIELSFHTGRNERAYSSFVNKMKELYLERREALKLIDRYAPLQFDLHSTIVIPLSSSKKQAFEIVKKIFRYFSWSFDDSTKKYMEEFYQKAIQDFTYGVVHSSWSIDTWTGFRVKLKFISETGFVQSSEGTQILIPEGGVCPATTSSYANGKLTLDDPIVRADGYISFAHSQCVEMPNALLNIDAVRDLGNSVRILGEVIRQINSHVFLFNRIKAKENCDENGEEKECTACPFDKMCTPCWATKRPWHKGWLNE